MVLQMSSNIAIRIHGLGKCYQIYAKPIDRLLQFFFKNYKSYYTEHWALQPLDLQIVEKDAIGIIGTNGSGKSTLLQLIAGTLSPTVGSLNVNGKVAALLELGAGFNPEFTGRENVHLAASLYGLSDLQIHQRFQKIADFAEIGDYIDQPVKTYSSGMYVRLAFAVIAHVDADILIIDEALAVGDAIFTQKCMRFIRDFRESGTLIFVSHDLHSVRSLCNKAVWLNKGKLEAFGDAKNICDEYLTSLLGNHDSKRKPNSSQTPNAHDPVPSRHPRLSYRDMRQDFVNLSNIRNDIQVFEFSESDSNFGGVSAKITDVHLVDDTGKTLLWCIGGEHVILKIHVLAIHDIHSPIIGFYLRDRLGQTLFGDNTYLTYADSPVAFNAQSEFVAEFEFTMPWLAKGDYVFSVAVADGTQDNHQQLHWIHDALVLSSQSSPLSTGIIGIPMKRISLS